jgi:L-threonylcarbamoyladenylate synthase
MNTELLKPTKEGIARSAELLRGGEAVAIPTETVYGLAANALDESAVAKIFAAKGRPADNPLIIHLQGAADFDDMALIDSRRAAMIDKLSSLIPGPLTVILPKRPHIPAIVSGGLDTIALRVPDHPVAQAVLKASGLPLAAPSANRSGSPSPSCARHVMDDLGGKIPAVLDGGECMVGVESTVLSLCGDEPQILRPGGATRARLAALLGSSVGLSPAVLAPLADGEKAQSPGMKYRHYAPKARVVLVSGDSPAFARWCNSRDCAALCFTQDAQYLRVPCFCYGSRDDHETLARLLFDGLRSLDEANFSPLIAAHAPDPSGMGLAVYNRLLRAAAFELVRV